MEKKKRRLKESTRIEGSKGVEEEKQLKERMFVEGSGVVEEDEVVEGKRL